MTLNDALAAYNQARRELTEFDAEFGPIMEQRSMLDSALSEAKNALTETMYASGIDYVEDGDFEVALIRQDRGFYDVTRLPKTQAVMDACAVTIASADVKKLIKRGLLTAEQADEAWESKPVSPYVRVNVKTAVPR